MQPFPHRYEVELRDGQLVAQPRPPIVVGRPPQFDGSDRVWSPEDLLVGAVLGCLWTTFVAYAHARKLEVIHWSASGTANLDRGTRSPEFTSIDVVVELVVPAGDEERARQVLASAESHCIISNALDVPVHLTATVHPQEAREVG